MKLDIGCGKNKIEGAIGIDISKNSDVDLICDIEKGLPFKDSVFVEIYCNQILEHVNDLIKLMEEIHRVCRSHAKVFISTPYYASLDAFSNPDHKRFITEYTFDMFTEWHCDSYITDARFKINKISFNYGILPKVFFFIPKIIFRRFVFNSTHGISFELEVVK